MTGMPVANKTPEIPKGDAPTIKCDEAYAIYFCADEMTPYVGAGKAGIDAYKAKFKKLPSGTIFDNGITYKAMNDAGIKRWFLVNAVPENAELYKKYGAMENTIVVCKAGGEPLGIFRCNECKQSQLVHFCKFFKEIQAGIMKPI